MCGLITFPFLTCGLVDMGPTRIEHFPRRTSEDGPVILWPLLSHALELFLGSTGHAELNTSPEASSEASSYSIELTSLPSTEVSDVLSTVIQSPVRDYSILEFYNMVLNVFLRLWAPTNRYLEDALSMSATRIQKKY